MWSIGSAALVIDGLIVFATGRKKLHLLLYTFLLHTPVYFRYWQYTTSAGKVKNFDGFLFIAGVKPALQCTL